MRGVHIVRGNAKQNTSRVCALSWRPGSWDGQVLRWPLAPISGMNVAQRRNASFERIRSESASGGVSKPWQYCGGYVGPVRVLWLWVIVKFSTGALVRTHSSTSDLMVSLFGWFRARCVRLLRGTLAHVPYPFGLTLYSGACHRTIQFPWRYHATPMNMKLPLSVDLADRR